MPALGQGDLSEAREATAAAKREVDKAGARCTSLESRCTSLSSQLSGATAHAASLLADLRAREADNEAMRRQLQEAEVRLADAEGVTADQVRRGGREEAWEHTGWGSVCEVVREDADGISINHGAAPCVCFACVQVLAATQDVMVALTAKNEEIRCAWMACGGEGG
jgi:hypothetical protein